MDRRSRAERHERAVASSARLIVLHILLAGCVAYAAACVVLLVVNYLVLPRLRPAVPSSSAPFLSMVVPARNEERAIGPALQSLLDQDYPSFEVVVVDDRSTDRTREILSRITPHPRLVVVDGAEPPPGWLGKPHALFQGARIAKGELLLFVDADVHYEPDAVSRAVAFLDDRGADFVALLPRIETSGFWEPVLMANMECSVFFGPAFLVLFPRPRWFAAGGGAGNLVRRRAYEAVGGHETIRASVVDDVRLAMEVKRAGYRALAVLADRLVSVRMYRGFREVWDGFTKNTAYVLSGIGGLVVASWLLAWTALSILPPAVVLAALAGAPVRPADVRLAADAWAFMVLARVGLAAALRKPYWPALTQPLMAGVWAALLVRSIYRRFIRRSLVWRGREFDARKAGF